MIKVLQHPSPAAFLHHAGTWLQQRECEHNRVLGLALEEVSRDSSTTMSHYVTVQSATELVGAAALTPSGLLEVTPMSQADVVAVINWFNALGVQIKEVICFALDDGRAGSGCELPGFQKEMQQRLYRCGQVVRADHVSGSLRKANMNDLPCLANWLTQFYIEIGRGNQPFDAEAVMRQRIESRSAFVWKDGFDASMACYGRPTPGGVAIYSVYTPPNLRSRGYASACTAALTERILAGGHEFCCLLADDANASTNSIYQKIGYRFVAMMEYWKLSNPQCGPGGCGG